MGANLIGVEAVDVGLALRDQLHRKLVQPFEVVGREEQRVPLEPEPHHVFLDRIDVLDVFLGRVGVVEPQIAFPARLLGDAEVQADRLRVADVEVSVRLGRKPGGDPAAVLSGGEIVGDDRANEVDRRLRRGRGVLIGHLCVFYRGNSSVRTSVESGTRRSDILAQVALVTKQ